MDNITLGQIALLLAEIAGVIVSIGTIVGVVIKLSGWIKKNRKEKEINPILEEIKKVNGKIEEVNKNVDDVRNDMSTKMDENYKQLNNKIDSLEINQCKDAIIDFISDVKSGKNVSSKEERAYEAYDKYTNVHHQNSYIHKLWEENVNTTKE
jgi:predicted  nucleic acid-binding Zn-ribbon protein